MTAPFRDAGPRRVIALLHRVEDAWLALLLGSIILLAPLQIVLRVVFDAGLVWADPFLRLLVLWVALFGALAASRYDKQIAIDVVSKFLSPRARAFVGFATGIFTALVCGIVAFHAGRFVWGEREYGAIAFAGLPAWMGEIVIPFTFALIGCRHLGHALRRAHSELGGVRPRADAARPEP